MGCKGFAYTRRSISVFGKLLLVALELPLKSHTLNTQDINSWETYSEIVSGKWASKTDRIFLGRLMSHIYENREETEVDLIAIILSVYVNIQKYARYICPRTQRTLCVNSSITTKSQAASSTAHVNYSIILPLKFTIIAVF
jgi:hypothetical protein